MREFSTKRRIPPPGEGNSRYLITQNNNRRLIVLNIMAFWPIPNGMSSPQLAVSLNPPPAGGIGPIGGQT